MAVSLNLSLLKQSYQFSAYPSDLWNNTWPFTCCHIFKGLPRPGLYPKLFNCSQRLGLLSKKFTFVGLILCTCEAFQVKKNYFLSLERDFREGFQKMIQKLWNLFSFRYFLKLSSGMPTECFTYMISPFHEHTIILIVYTLKLRVGEPESFAKNCSQTQISISCF